jgi:release factor glutamine methyltransferase
MTSMQQPTRPAGADAAVVARLRAGGCVFAEDEARLLIAAAGAADPLRASDRLAALVRRRVAGEPLEQILGWAEFCGLRIGVEPGVFVPRRRTEFLVREAAALARGLRRPRPVVLDLCCGTGAVGAALAAAIGGVELYAADLDPVAVRCARRNVAAAGGQVFEGDLYAPLPSGLRGCVELLVVNAPYVPTDAIALMPTEARDHEARAALDGGADGLDVQRRVIAEAPDWLAPKGYLLVETSRQQASGTLGLADRAGLIPRVAGSDGLDSTIVIAHPRPASAANRPAGGATDPG